MAVVLTGVYGDEEDFRPEPAGWSPRIIAAHVADAELALAFRMRQVIAEDSPTLMAFDGEAWAGKLDYGTRKPKQSLDSFRRLRTENYELLKSLPESAFERSGNHTEDGRMTLRQLVEGGVSHVEGHMRQLQTVRDEYKKGKARHA